MHPFIKEFLYAFVAIFPMINPLALTGAFLTLTKEATVPQRNKLSFRVSLYGLILLIGTLFIGPFILYFLGLQVADIRIAGGMVVTFIAWRMLNAQPKNRHEKDQESLHDSSDDDHIMKMAFFPLTMPLTAGAGGIAITIALATQVTNAGFEGTHVFMNYAAITCAIAVVFLMVFVCYRFSSWIFKFLGRTGSQVVTQISAFFLVAIGVQVLWSGIKLLILQIH